jgi:hypothetical protein
MQKQEFRDLARELKSNLSRLMEKRSTWESHWQECADFIQPRKAEITKERARGDKRNVQIFDATAIHALELLAASLHGMLTSSANRWFSLRYKEDQLNDSDEAKEWLQDATDKMAASAAVEKFGIENLSKESQTTFQKDPFKELEFVHVVRPRNIYNERKADKANMPFQSIYFEYNNGHIISVGGFRELPYVIPRYLKASTEIYGRSPAMNALPDVKVLNKMVETALKAAAKQVDPPLLVPDDSMLSPIRMSAGSLNYYRSGSRDRIEPLQIGQATSATLNQENQRREAIAKMFHVDQLVVSSNRTMTATEVVQRNEEKMRILGPVLGRLQSELLQPMILRVFNIMLRNQIFLQAPEILAEQEIDIEYVSPMALAQRGQELQSLMRGLEMFAQIAPLAPVQDYIDENGLVKQIISLLGLPAKMIKSDKEVMMMREERAAAQAQQAEMMQSMQESQIAKNAAPMVKELNAAE